jgi:hypothetical protein
MTTSILLRRHHFGILLPLLTCHYLSACGFSFFQNTSRGRSSCAHKEAPSPPCCLFSPILDTIGVPQGHPSRNSPSTRSNPTSPFRSNTAARRGRGYRLVGPLKRAGVQLPRKCQVSTCAIRSRPPPQRMHRPTSETHYRSGSGRALGTAMHKPCIVAPRSFNPHIKRPALACMSLSLASLHSFLFSLV